ncbi:CbtA family protein [Tsukamurella sp. 1534]|uniref:CbtA family protein n=1 Tax=Tsukamurella sp. 1534 TaxID=1151061 RepID=UPI0002E77E10|nr:CbtA family protein [Tsukamurella sp. 1534]
MEKQVIARGVLAGAIAGVLAFVFGRIMVEPVIRRAIEFQERSEAAEHAGHAATADAPEVFSRTVQENLGFGAGLILFGAVLGALFAVAYCVAAPKVPSWSPRALALAVAGSLFLGVYAVPYLKYPPNPPGVGDPDSIGERTGTYLLLVAIGVALVAAAWAVALAAADRLGGWSAALVGGAVVLAGAVLAYLVLPAPLSAGDFPADDLTAFRTYSFLAQAVLFGGIGLIGGELLQRLTVSRGTREAVAA